WRGNCRSGVRIEPASARHASLRAVHPAVRTGCGLARGRPRTRGRQRHRLQPLHASCLDREKYTSELSRLRAQARMIGQGYELQAVFFDLDGTLVDSAPDLIVAMQRLRTERGNKPVAVTRIGQGYELHAVFCELERTLVDSAPDLIVAMQRLRTELGKKPVDVTAIGE